MSEPIFPLAVWQEGTLQNDIPANDNALRVEAMSRRVISDSTTAQPGSPADGDVYIIPSAATGTQWSTFDEGDVTIYRDGTWIAFAPVPGVLVNVSGSLKQWTGSAWASTGSGSGVQSIVAGAGISVDSSDPENPVVASTAPAARNNVTALSSSGGAVNINIALGDYFTLTLTENITSLTFSNPPGVGKGATLMLKITQDSTPRTVAWPASFRWEGGTAGMVSTASGAVDLIAITTFDNGTTWDASLGKDFA